MSKQLILPVLLLGKYPTHLIARKSFNQPSISSHPIAAAAFIATRSTVVVAYQTPGIRLLANFFSGKLLETTLNPELGDEPPDTAEPSQFTMSNGNTSYHFIDRISHADRRGCGLHDQTLAGHRPSGDGQADDEAQQRRSGRGGTATQPLRLHCRPGHGNGSMLMIRSYKDMLHLIAPHGNATTAKRQPQQQLGNCALLLFYSRTCYMSSKLAPQFNPLPHLFPDLRVGAIDAVRFHEINTELGIVGLPTLMLFHQARPVVRFNGTLSRVSTNFLTIAQFVTEFTGIESRLRSPAVIDGGEMFALRPEHFEGPLDGQLVIESDWCLWLAWAFIAVCCAYGFGRTRLYASMVEYVKRNWRESEAQHERVAR